MSWFRLYVETMDDPKVMQLDPKVFRAWVICLCLAKEGNAGYGVIPPASVVAFKLHVSESAAAKYIAELVEKQLIDVTGNVSTPHNWNGRQYQSDVSTTRVQRFRNKQTGVSRNSDETFQKRLQSTEYRVQSTEPLNPLPTFDLEAAFEKLWEAYPAKGRTRKPMSQQYYTMAVAVAPEDQQAAIHAKIIAPVLPGGKWAKSANWAKGYVQGLAVYLNQQQWMESPEPAGAESTPGNYDHLPLGFTAAEKAKIERVARERAEDGLV
jgi:hypothetical protein